jgi:hypothetical protein
VYVTEENKWGEGGSDTKWLREDVLKMRGSEKNAREGGSDAQSGCGRISVSFFDFE